MTLDEVLAAASARAASLVPETSGYLALAIGDATSRLPLLHDDRALLLTTEGGMSASRRGEVVSPEKAAKAMRDTLARLLAVSSGTMPGLAAAARPRDESARGVDAVIEEIEAALIPVNRAAAQRALARLSRETLRAKEAGKLKPKRVASVRPPPRPAAVAAAPRVVFSEPPAPPTIVEPPANTVFSEPPPLAPRIEAPLVESRAVVADTKSVTPEAGSAVVDAQPVVVEAQSVARDAEPAVVVEPAVAEAPPRIVDAAPALAVAPATVVETLPLPVHATIAVPDLSLPVLDAVTVIPSEQIVVARVIAAIEPPAPTPSPLDPRFEERDFAEPTPTTLGMAIEIDEAPTPLAAMEIVHATALGAAALVEEHSPAVIHAPVVMMPVIPAEGFARPSEPPTRADDLLATFAVSCSDAAAVREATDCLKKLAGLDPTPPPIAVALPVPVPAPKPAARPATPRAPVVAAPRVARVAPPPAPAPLPSPKARPALDALRDQLEEQGRSPRKRSRSGLSLVAALLAGAVVGLVAVTRLRPDLVTSFEDRVGPALGSERTAPPAPAPAARPR
ncbi:MAG: hypothetical protein ABJE95_17010 [Byssovorax sp.]